MVLIESDIEAPVEAILDAPVRAYDLAEPLRRHLCTQQVIGGLCAGCIGCLANPNNLADCGETRPVMRLLEPGNIAREHGRACLDAAVVAVHRAGSDRQFGLWIVKEGAHV